MSVSTRRVPFVDLSRQHTALREEIDAALASVVNDAHFILGSEVDAFEQEWATYCGARHCVGLASGTAAIELTLEALDIGAGDEVIVPANTFVATVFPVLHRGATPVLVDCDENGLIDIDQVEANMTQKTRAVIPVHLYGRLVELDELVALCREKGIAIVEDACQAHGAKLQGRRAGTFGLAGCFSFYPSKNLGAFGDAGAVVTNDDELAAKIRLLRDLGQVRKYEHLTVGHNERLDAIQAAVLRVKLRQLDGWNAQRRALAARYTMRLADTSAVVPQSLGDERSVWHLYVVRVQQRDEVQRRMEEAGIATGIHYPRPLHKQPPLAALGLDAERFPVAENWSNTCLSLPMFPELTETEVDLVADVLIDALAASRSVS